MAARHPDEAHRERRRARRRLWRLTDAIDHAEAQEQEALALGLVDVAETYRRHRAELTAFIPDGEP